MEFDEKKFNPFSNRELLYQQVEEQSDICDVTIQVDTWKKKFHWCVLVRSPFFERIQRSNFIEKQTGVVKLDVATPLATDIAILFLYGKKPKLTGKNVAAVLELSEFLLIPNLKSACVAFIKKISITEENCMKMLELTSLYEFELTQVGDYIRCHLPEILRMEEARFLKKESVLALFSDQVLSYVLDEDKFEFAIRWAKASQQNKDAFPDVFEMIDLKSMGGKFLQTVVLQHPLVTEMKLNHSNLCSRDTPQAHRILLFPELNDEKRMACFDIDSERWCGIETGLPDDSDIGHSIRNASVDGTCGYMEVYRVVNRFGICEICIQNLHSKEYTIKTVSKQEYRISAYEISEEACVTVSNERKTVYKRPDMSMSISSAEEFTGLEMPRQKGRNLRSTRLLLAGYIQPTYEDNATVYYGQLQNSEITLCPLLTIRNTSVDLVCISANNAVAFYSKKNGTLHIYDMYHCTLDAISFNEHFDQDYRSETRVAANEAGFVLYNKEIVLSVSRLNGPDLTERYTVHKTKLDHDRKWDRNINFYCNRMWFRLSRKKWKDDVEFSCISHDELMDVNGENVAWNQLPSPPNGTCTREENNAFMMELPKSMLRCHYDCPHCSQLKKEQLQQRRNKSRNIPRAVAEDFLYDDSDDDSLEDFNY